MRIAELSGRTGVPVPTIKYYLREGLLPPGEFSSPNQARYGEPHARRLRLVRALVEVGRLPISTIRELLASIDEPEPDLHFVLGRALKSASASQPPPGDAELSAADREVDELITRLGWQVCETAPARRAAAEVIAALRQLGADDVVAQIDGFAAAAERAAATDLAVVREVRDPAALVYTAVVGTILGDPLIAALRRLAQESLSAQVFGDRQH